MARTATGKALTDQHYSAQLRIRALALRDYLRLWPIWQGDETSFREMVTAAVVLVKAYQQMSAQAGASYFDAFRLVEAPGGSARSWLADPMTPEAEDRLIATLYETGRNSVRDSIAAGRSPRAAMDVALTNTSGTVTRNVLDGGRASILRSTANDDKALGWARVTSNDPCAFCAMLASRGAVYISEDTADFKAHGHCSCGAEPGYEGTEFPGRGDEFREMYNQAISDARAAGELDPSGKNYLLNAFRRFYERERRIDVPRPY